MEKFDLNATERKRLLEATSQALENFYGDTKYLKVASERNVSKIRTFAEQFDFDKNHDPATTIETVIEGLKKFAVQTSHPNYYGLFNPRSNYVAALADYITAIMNPQMAAWSHAPFAAEMERKCIVEFGKKFGYAADSIDGTFCSGGAESNLTAVLCALNHHFPDYAKTGLIGMSTCPIIYCSSESHHSILKAAKVCGLGSTSVKSISVNNDLTLNTQNLEKAIREDNANRNYPMMIIGTAGTTGAGAIDDLNTIKEICEANKLWFHVDAAYGGAVIATEKYRHWLSGIENSDSITIDLHKKFSVPMGVSLFLTSDNEILHRTFGVHTDYMPKKGDPNQVVDAYVHSIQWSRRLMGLKIYLPLAIYGWKGYDEMISHQIAMGDELKAVLKAHGWIIKNDSQLPIVCFTHPDIEKLNNGVQQLQEKVVASGKAWISVYPIHGKPTLRACITNYATKSGEIQELVAILNELKSKI